MAILQFTDSRLHSHRNPDNLVFLCMSHHDQYDAGTSQSKNLTEAEVRKYRTRLHRAIEDGSLWVPSSLKILRHPAFASDGVVQNVTGVGNVVSGGDITLNIRVPGSRRRGGQAPIIPGTVGEEPRMIGYLKYLAKQYNTFKEWECETSGQVMRYGLIYAAYARNMRYGMAGTPTGLFEDGVQYLQRRIRNTKLGRIKRGQRLFCTFEEFEGQGSDAGGPPVSAPSPHEQDVSGQGVQTT